MPIILKMCLLLLASSPSLFQFSNIVATSNFTMVIFHFFFYLLLVQESLQKDANLPIE